MSILKNGNGHYADWVVSLGRFLLYLAFSAGIMYATVRAALADKHNRRRGTSCGIFGCGNNIGGKILLFVILCASTTYGQIKYRADESLTPREKESALSACERRGHVVPFGGKSYAVSGVLNDYVEDYPDSTIRIVEVRGKIEEGVCSRCKELVQRVYSTELFRQRVWIDSTKFDIDSTGKATRKR